MNRYNVLDRETAARFGIKSDGEYNHHVLVAMRTEDVVDNVVCWGFKRQNLQTIADKRNEDFNAMRQKMKHDDT